MDLFRDMATNDSEICFEVTLALFILPALITKVCDYPRLPPQTRALRPTIDRPVDLLRRFAASNQKARDIIQQYTLKRDYPLDSQPRTRNFNVEVKVKKLIKKAEKASPPGSIGKKHGLLFSTCCRAVSMAWGAKRTSLLTMRLMQASGKLVKM